MGTAGIGKRRDWSGEGTVLPWKPEEKAEEKRQEFKELQQSIDLNNARKERDQLEKELRGAQMVIDDLRARNNIAQHDVFKAEVEMRRAQQKRRNQKLELKRLHNAVNERNNRIRNLERDAAELERFNSRQLDMINMQQAEIDELRDGRERQLEMIQKQHDEISGLRVMNVRAE